MKLTSIKLSGFKSFVDPTTIRFQGKLNGIVGPNGCGKSNIMDAVRWVLGESRASELRGESMKDVIFNGTTSRKPAGRASVELVFDNSDGRIGGQWGQYTELAVRRVLTRDGGSTYSINGTTVRRRDIHDIFLGTGLGPRAYAIIGQGMISRIIEARPEELRTFLEEAAGISKYKDRRKETARRLSDSQENLNRVLDILSEQDQQIEKLQQQAELADVYNTLSAQRDRQQQFFWILQKQDSEKSRISFEQATEKARTEFEQIRAGMFHCDAQLEKLRSDNELANQSLHDAQGVLYGINTEIGSLTAQINYITETRKRLEAQMTSLQAQKEQWQTQIPEFTAELETVQEAIAEHQIAQESAEETLDFQQEAFAQAETVLNEQREQERHLKDDTQQIQRQIAVAANTHKSLRNAITECGARREKLAQHRQRFNVPDEKVLEGHVQAKDEAEQYLQELLEQQANAEGELQAALEAKAQVEDAFRACRESVIQLESRLNTLRQIEEKAGRKEKLGQWLKDNQLEGFKPLWRHITSEAGWELAVETVLADRMKAIELSNLEWTDAFAKGTLPARLSFYHAESAESIAGADSHGLSALKDRIQTERPYLMPVLASWLHGVYTSPNLATAIQNRHQLPEGACFVVPEGHRVDRFGVRLYAQESENEGFYSRHQEILRLEKKHDTQRQELDQMSVRLREVDAGLKTHQATARELTASIEKQNRLLNDIRFRILKEEENQRYYKLQQEQIAAQIKALDEDEREKQLALAEQEQLLEGLDLTLAEKQEKEEDFHTKVVEAENRLNHLREHCHSLEKQIQQARFAQQTATHRKSELTRQIETADQQIQAADEQIAKNTQELEKLEHGIQEANLQTLLDKRLAQEQVLAEKRNELDGIAQQLRTVMEQRMQFEQQLQPQQDQIVALQLKEQEARINAEQYVQKLQESGVNESELLVLMPDNLKSSTLQAEITRITHKIEALGPVNLGASLELKEGLERRQYLQEQHQDLTDAISTLEDAIKRIDRETRQQLRTTFDQVNKSLDEMFPILFGGGKSQLIMNGDEILDAGIQIMAQPPGKKNATIHLLSGGEKALTALALVFSLFQLNPAPFCLLDEVDAPLDDANTGRFSSLVRKMSEQTQFLFISHNQIAMEMAEELIGVTMQEKGVSRIVTVDLSNAGEFAEKGVTV